MTAEEWAEKVVKVTWNPQNALAWGPGYEMLGNGKAKATGYLQLVYQCDLPEDKRTIIQNGLRLFMADVFRQVQDDAVRQFAQEITGGRGSPDDVRKYRSGGWFVMPSDLVPFPAKPIEHNGV